MACTSCAGQSASVAVDNNAIAETNVLIDVGTQRPLKIGEPMSTACERSTRRGSIPEVIRFPKFTTVNGAVVAGITSSAGIAPASMVAFMRNNTGGCYNELTMQASTCA